MLYPERLNCLLEARRSYHGDNKLQKWEYPCVQCLIDNPERAYYKLKEVIVDHKIPCGSFLCDDDYDAFIIGLFCKKGGLQVMCKPCHQIKTNEERAVK